MSNYFKLRNKIMKQVAMAGQAVFTLYLPSRQGALDALAHELIQHLAERFGGCTVHEGKGHWIPPKGVVVSEKVHTVTVVSDNSSITRRAFYGMVEHFAKVSGEQQVLYTIGGADVIYINKEY